MNRFLLLSILFAGCAPYSVNVKRLTYGRGNLASTWVKSPDPAQEKPPKGQKLFVSYRIPPKRVSDPPILSLHMIFRNYTEELVRYPIYENSGSVSYELMDEKFYEKGGFLTYKAELKTEAGEVLANWEQQMWVNLIEEN